MYLVLKWAGKWTIRVAENVDGDSTMCHVFQSVQAAVSYIEREHRKDSTLEFKIVPIDPYGGGVINYHKGMKEWWK